MITVYFQLNSELMTATRTVNLIKTFTSLDYK